MSSNTCLKSCLYFFFENGPGLKMYVFPIEKGKSSSNRYVGLPEDHQLLFWMMVSNILYVQPLFKGKMNPFWRAYFSDGLVQPPTSYTSKDGLKPPTSFKWVLENGPFVGLPEDHQLLFGWPQKNPRRCYAPAMYAVSLHNLVGSKCRSEFFGRGSNRPQMPRYTCRDFDPWKTPVTVPINKAIFWGL